MKLANVSKGLLLSMTLLLTTSLFAANKNQGSLSTLSAVTVNGKALPAGDYSVKWEGTGSNVQLNIFKGKEVVATAPARLVNLDQSASGDAAVVKDNGNGSKSLAEIRFSGKKYALQIGDEGTMEAGNSSK